MKKETKLLTANRQQLKAYGLKLTAMQKRIKAMLRLAFHKANISHYSLTPKLTLNINEYLTNQIQLVAKNGNEKVKISYE